MLTELEIPKFVDPTVSDLSLKWAGELRCLPNSHGSITDEVPEWVRDTFRRISKENHNWILDQALPR